MLVRELSQSLATLRQPSKDVNAVDSAFRAIEHYERLASEVYRLRSKEPSLNDAEEMLANSAQDLMGLGSSEKTGEKAYVTFIRQYRTAWRKHFALFIFTVCLFTASCFLGWNIGVNQPDYVGLFAGQEIMEMIHDHEAWFEKLKSDPLMGAAQIGLNNIRVAILGFTLGAAFGLGGMYILVFNGVSFGAILGYCVSHDFEEPLLQFVASHGPLELTLIIASCFAGLLIGRAFYRRPFSKMRERLGESAGEAGVLAVGIIPWLLVAALFEGFMSPMEFVPFSVKLMCGLASAGAFWFWTFGPVPPSRQLR